MSPTFSAVHRNMRKMEPGFRLAVFTAPYRSTVNCSVLMWKMFQRGRSKGTERIRLNRHGTYSRDDMRAHDVAVASWCRLNP
jgi:hypothetical protein